MNAVADRPLFDLQALFADLRTVGRRDGYGWLYATIFSTLLPTFLHLAVSACSLYALIPIRARQRVAEWIGRAEERTVPKWGAALALSLMATFATLAPLLLTALVGLALYHFHPEIGGGYLFVFEWFARAIGAPVTPGPLLLGG